MQIEQELIQEGDLVERKGGKVLGKVTSINGEVITIKTETSTIFGNPINFRKWKPKEGDWVIPDTGIDIHNDTFIVYKYQIRGSILPDRCQPFIGTLPKPFV